MSSSHSLSDTDKSVPSPDGSSSGSSTCPTPPPQSMPDTSHDVAIVCFSFDFPAANSEESLWDLVMQGKCAALPFPKDRFQHARFHETVSTNHISPSICRSCSEILTIHTQIRAQKASFAERDISAFDARFFSMTEDEAVATDPQLRILLETSCRALRQKTPKLCPGTRQLVWHTACCPTASAPSISRGQVPRLIRHVPAAW